MNAQFSRLPLNPIVCIHMNLAARIIRMNIHKISLIAKSAGFGFRFLNDIFDWNFEKIRFVHIYIYLIRISRPDSRRTPFFRRLSFSSDRVRMA